MLFLTTLVLVGSGLAASPAVKKMGLGKSPRRTWLSERPMDRDRAKRTPESVFIDTIQKALEPLFGETRRRHLGAMRSVAATAETTALEKTAYRELGLSLLNTVTAAVGVLLFYPVLLLTTPVVVYLWRDAFKGAYQALVKDHHVTVDVLYALTTVLMITTNYLFLMAAVAALYCFSRVLLIKTQDHARASLSSTFGLEEREVWLVKEGVEVAMPLEQLEVGDIVVVRAGDVIPVDGYITEGVASVDQHMLTGEAQPVEKTAEDYVFATTILLTGKIYIRVDRTGQDTTAGQIVDILHQTVDYRTALVSRGQVLNDRLALPVLLLGGLALFTVGATGAMAVFNANMFMSILIVGPLCMLNFLNLTAKNNMLVKDGRALEQLSHVDTVVFDKTGTLTREQPYVGEVHTFAEYDEDDILTYAAAAEYHQTHPIAIAIVEKARALQLVLPEMQQAEYKVGYGISVVVDYATVHVGSMRFMAMEDISLPADLQPILDHAQNEGNSVVMVAMNHRLVGAIELQATIRSEVRRVIAQLRERGISTLCIISGDHETPTKRLAQTLGMDSYFAETLPQDKAVIIEQLQAQGKVVCYVGDGINDAIALKKAQVSVSLRGASTAATDTAQVVLLDEGLGRLGDLFTIADDFNKTLTTSFVLSIAPGVLNIFGAFFLHFGFMHSVICNQIGFWASVGSSMQPALKTAVSKDDGLTEINRPMADAPRLVQKLKPEYAS